MPISVYHTAYDGFGAALAKWSSQKPQIALYFGRYLTSTDQDWWFGFEAPYGKELVFDDFSNLAEYLRAPKLEITTTSIPLLSARNVAAAEKNGGFVYEHDFEYNYFGRYVQNSKNVPDEQIASDAIQFVSRVVEALDPLLAERRDLEQIKNFDITTRKQLVDARRGQGKFRSGLERHWNGCAVLGCRTREALRASHIKSWSTSSNTERLSTDNGLLLTATFDALFDKHLISFDDNGRMLIADVLSDEERQLLQVHKPLGLSRKPSRNQCSFLAMHRASAERRWGAPLSPIP